jgi:hypothetical protein
VTPWADLRRQCETQQAPLGRPAAELPHLTGLPVTADVMTPVVYRTGNAAGFLASRQNLSSVPWRHFGQLLFVRVTEDEVAAG